MSALGVGPESIANDHNDYNGVSVEPMFHRPLSSTIVLDRRVNTARARGLTWKMDRQPFGGTCYPGRAIVRQIPWLWLLGVSHELRQSWVSRTCLILR
jgi:hypothetical protein